MHPIAFDLGPFPIHWYGVLVALGFVAGLWTASRRGLRSGVAADNIIDLGPWLILGAIVGARTLYVISYWSESFAGRPIGEIFAVWRGGRTPVRLKWTGKRKAFQESIRFFTTAGIRNG